MCAYYFYTVCLIPLVLVMFGKYTKTLSILLLFVAAFVAASFLANKYEYVISELVHSAGIYAPIGFVVLTALFVIFVIPLDVVFLIPIGVSVWGPVPTALMSITGWVVGAAVAFYIARNFGSGVVKKIIGLRHVEALERRIPKRNLFWIVVLWRMAVSVDVLSYALGLISKMSFGSYVLATAIGVAPFGFFFAYAGVLPAWYQALVLVIMAISIVSILYIYKLPQKEL